MRCAVVVALLLSCGGPQISEHPTAQVTKFLPATLEAQRPKEGEPRTAKVRVYVDAAVRALPHWKEDIGEQIDYASQLLTPLVGMRLVVESTKDWDRSGDAHEALRQLAALDKGEGVEWVIGYVAPGERSSKAFSELGDAQPLGHHVVVRAWPEALETAALAGKLPDAREAGRAEVIAAHRRHKETCVLLHELAATLGAVAEQDPTWLQNPTYAPSQNTFSERNRELLQLGADARLAGKPDGAVAKALLESIEKSEWGGWIAADREQVATILRNVIDAAKQGKTASDIPPAVYDEFNRIKELARRGQGADAMIELNNLIAAYPGNASMQELKCEILIAKPGVAAPETRAACGRVSEIAPGDPNVHIAVAEALMGAKDIAGARKELAQAEGKIANLSTGAPEAWHRVIALYQGVGALTWTEDALARGKLAGDPAAAATAQKRARYGIPRGAKFVRPDDEAALVIAIRGALDAIYAGKFADAERALAAAEKRWPGAPGLMGARCDLQFRQNNFGAARAACARAIAADKDNSWALYLAAVIALRDASGTAEGIAKLKAAIAVDPDLGQAWRTLSLAYARVKNQAALDQLAADYAQKFGQPLPPPPQ